MQCWKLLSVIGHCPIHPRRPRGSLWGRGKVYTGEKKIGEEKSRTKIIAIVFVLDFSSPIFFFARIDFPPPPLTAPGSPRMARTLIVLVVLIHWRLVEHTDQTVFLHGICACHGPESCTSHQKNSQK